MASTGSGVAQEGQPDQSAPDTAKLADARRALRAKKGSVRARRTRATLIKAQRRNPFRRLGERIDRLKWQYKLLLAAVFCLAMVVLTFVFRARIAALGDWGYLGAFTINGISNATIVLPAPGGAVIAIMARDFNPLLIGLAAGVGGTLGNSSAYMAGFVASSNVRRSKWARWLERFMGRFGGLVIFVSALVPFLPGDLASIVAGSVRYPYQKWLLFSGLAGIIKMIIIAYIGAELLASVEDIAIEWIKSLL